MYVRVAFAIAASVEPDILIIDEALAVGDAVFQHRCLGRIKELHERGTTVLFVSHDAAAVRALCSRAILMKAGTIVADGKPSDVLNRYQKIIMEREEAYRSESRPERAAEALEVSPTPVRFTYRHGDGSAEIIGAELLVASDRPVEIVETGERPTLRIAARLNTALDEPVIGFLIKHRHGIHVYGTNSTEQRLELRFARQAEVLEVTFAFNCWLGIDQYSISLAIHSRAGEAFDWLDGAMFLRVTSMDHFEGVANLNASVTARARSIDAANDRGGEPAHQLIRA